MEEDLIITTHAKLADLVATAAASGIQTAIPDVIRQANEPPFLTTARVLEITGWSLRTLQDRKAEGLIAYVNRGRKSFYPTDEFYSYFRSEAA